jgi:predicted MPP superfamily phosphohydrolase
MPRILLAHHPSVFIDSPFFGVAFTLAGHTHGGGQVVVAEWDGRPIAIGSAVYRYMSGLYREGEHTLYVNRGIGYVGLPIRINCPPEISRFRLTRG